VLVHRDKEKQSSSTLPMRGRLIAALLLSVPPQAIDEANAAVVYRSIDLLLKKEEEEEEEVVVVVVGRQWCSPSPCDSLSSRSR